MCLSYECWRTGLATGSSVLALAVPWTRPGPTIVEVPQRADERLERCFAAWWKHPLCLLISFAPFSSFSLFHALSEAFTTRVMQNHA